MGSLNSGTSRDGGDACGFKLLVWDEKNGAVALQAAPSSDASYPGSPMYNPNHPWKESTIPGTRCLNGTRNGCTYMFYSLAIEVGEKESYGSYAKFKKAALAAELDLSQLDEGVARYKASDGKHLGIHWNDNPMNLGIWRNGIRRDLKGAARKLYDSPIIHSDRGSGTLRIEARRDKLFD